MTATNTQTGLTMLEFKRRAYDEAMQFLRDCVQEEKVAALAWVHITKSAYLTEKEYQKRFRKARRGNRS